MIKKMRLFRKKHEKKHAFQYDNPNCGVFIWYFFAQLIENNFKNSDREVDIKIFWSEIANSIRENSILNK